MSPQDLYDLSKKLTEFLAFHTDTYNDGGTIVLRGPVAQFTVLQEYSAPHHTRPRSPFYGACDHLGWMIGNPAGEEAAILVIGTRAVFVSRDGSVQCEQRPEGADTKTGSHFYREALAAKLHDIRLSSNSLCNQIAWALTFPDAPHKFLTPEKEAEDKRTRQLWEDAVRAQSRETYGPTPPRLSQIIAGFLDSPYSKLTEEQKAVFLPIKDLAVALETHLYPPPASGDYVVTPADASARLPYTLAPLAGALKEE